jgi:hypothetical protein
VFGYPVSVCDAMEGRDKLQPNPYGPSPAPESYESESCGPNPYRPGLVAIGTVIEPVPSIAHASGDKLRGGVGVGVGVAVGVRCRCGWRFIGAGPG